MRFVASAMALANNMLPVVRNEYKKRADNILISTMCYDNQNDKMSLPSNVIWNSRNCDFSSNSKLKRLKPFYPNFCYISVFFAFVLGLLIGVLIPVFYFANNYTSINYSILPLINDISDNSQQLQSIFINNSYSNLLNSSEVTDDKFSSVKFVEPRMAHAKTNTDDKYVTYENNNSVEEVRIGRDIISDGIYWGQQVESALPKGYGKIYNDMWSKFLKSSVAVRLESGCGRMQNRLVTFEDGSQACVRYRQNTDQIQGELFSFYLAQILGLSNLAPSAISIVDLNDPLWKNIANDISSAQWNSNRPVVLTQYINNLDSAHIPNIFKPIDRHLNKYDIRNLTMGNDKKSINVTLEKGSRVMNELIELVQWSDLIIFDYLTANLDRIVNNLYNYQWNANIMDAPAHNLARKIDSNLLVFLDNESGLLHGYRLLKKYEIYHSLLLENLCVFRKSTSNMIKQLKNNGDIGKLLRDMYERQNSDNVKDILPTIPDKSVKILNERIDRVYNQIIKCESSYSEGGGA